MEIDSETKKKALMAFNQRIAQSALAHQDRYTARTGTILSSKGMVEGIRHENAAPELPAIIARADHPERLPTPEGPLLFCRTEPDSTSIICVEMVEMLIHPELPVRSGAIGYFKRLGSQGMLCKNSVWALDHWAAEAGSSEEVSWQKAAVNVLDVLEEDYLLLLAGLRQSIAVGYKDMIGKFVVRALLPSIASVDALGSEIMVAAANPPEVEARIGEIARSSASFLDLCSKYFDAFGHLPLAGTLSMEHAFGSWWQKRQPQAEPVEYWQQAKAWAETTGSPLAWYQILSLFVQRSDLVPAKCQGEFRTELLRFFEPLAEDLTDCPVWAAALALRNQTAIHYYNYLISRASAVAADILGEWAWWMAERFCSCFGTDVRWMQWVSAKAVQPASERSAYESALTPPDIKRSNLYYSTLFADHLWSLSLLTCMDAKFISTVISEDSAMSERLMEETNRFLTITPPVKTDDSKPTVYVVDQSLYVRVEEWCAALSPGVFSETLQTGLVESRRRFDSEVIFDRLRNLLTLSRDELLATILTLRLSLVAAGTPDAEILSRISEPAWLEAAVHRLRLDDLEKLLSALCAAQFPGEEAWSGWLYQLAAICEQPTLSEERRSMTFEFIVLASALSDGFGAVSKLLRGPHRSLFSQDATRIGAKFESAYPQCSQAVKATIRSISVALHGP